MRKEVFLILVPVEKNEVKIGDILLDKNHSNKLLESAIEGGYNKEWFQLVELYLICDDEIKEGDKFYDFRGIISTCKLVSIGTSKKVPMITCEYEGCYLVSNCKKIIANPENIGNIMYMPQGSGRTWRRREIELSDIKSIMTNDRKCFIEMETIPDLQSWSEDNKKCKNVEVPILTNNKVTIYLNDGNII